MQEWDSRRELVEVDGDYRIAVTRTTAGRWLVHCRMCKHRQAFPDRDAALRYADGEHQRRYTHQRWVGRLALGGHLSVQRGYDKHGVNRGCRCGYCEDCVRFAKWRRPPPPPPRPPRPDAWSLQPAGTGPTSWIINGRIYSGMPFMLTCNGEPVVIVSKTLHGYVVNGQFLPGAHDGGLDVAAALRAAG